jgi:hypothetical protein
METPDINAINFERISLDKPIFRIIPMQRLIELFKSQSNVLVKPSLWQDPYENYVLNGKFQLPNGSLINPPMRNSFFAQCWSLKSQSEALWRLYSESNRKDGVQIRTTIRRLYESIHNQLWPEKADRIFIGKVDYKTIADINGYASTAFLNSTGFSGRNWAETLLFKRKAFTHEQEIRLLYFGYSWECEAQDTFSYSINPHTLIDRIILDPRLSDSESTQSIASIRKRTKFKGRIARSNLYQSPQPLLIPYAEN